MKIPPYAVALRIAEEERTKFHIWFPLFLLWPLAIVFLMLTFIVSVIVDFCHLFSGRKTAYTRLFVGVLGLLGETRGTEVFIQDHARSVALRLQ